LGRLALGFCERQEGFVFVEGRVGGAEAGVAGAVDSFGGVVGDELGGWVVGVEFDLVYCWDDLGWLAWLFYRE
jgi:hypothetical protein